MIPAIDSRAMGERCSDCPPVGHSTDRTRCDECPVLRGCSTCETFGTVYCLQRGGHSAAMPEAEVLAKAAAFDPTSVDPAKVYRLALIDVGAQLLSASGQSYDYSAKQVFKRAIETVMAALHGVA